LNNTDAAEGDDGRAALVESITLVVLSVGCLVTPTLMQGHQRLPQDTITRKIEEPSCLRPGRKTTLERESPQGT